MPATTHCPKCQTALALPPEFAAGQAVRCPDCREVFTPRPDEHHVQATPPVPQRAPASVAITGELPRFGTYRTGDDGGEQLNIRRSPDLLRGRTRGQLAVLSRF